VEIADDAVSQPTVLEPEKPGRSNQVLWLVVGSILLTQLAWLAFLGAFVYRLAA
jgi:hypothetical protein